MEILWCVRFLHLTKGYESLKEEFARPRSVPISATMSERVSRNQCMHLQATKYQPSCHTN